MVEDVTDGVLAQQVPVAVEGGGVLADALSTVGGVLIDELVAKARQQGLELSGPNGLLAALTKRVLESALEGEITEHLGYERHDPTGRGSATPATEAGPRRC